MVDPKTRRSLAFDAAGEEPFSRCITPFDGASTVLALVTTTGRAVRGVQDVRPLTATFLH